jgi:hypothetical protein
MGSMAKALDYLEVSESLQVAAEKLDHEHALPLGLPAGTNLDFQEIDDSVKVPDQLGAKVITQHNDIRVGADARDEVSDGGQDGA